MSSGHEGQTDEQGLVFFNLEPDQLVQVKVAAKGYHDFEDTINIKPNVTYFVEANMCRDVNIFDPNQIHTYFIKFLVIII